MIGFVTWPPFLYQHFTIGFVTWPPFLYQHYYKGGQVTEPIVKMCYKLLHVIQGVKSILIK